MAEIKVGSIVTQKPAEGLADSGQKYKVIDLGKAGGAAFACVKLEPDDQAQGPFGSFHLDDLIAVEPEAKVDPVKETPKTDPVKETPKK